MLGKLIRHEWKSTYKAGGLMLLLILLLTLFGVLSFQTPLWQHISRDDSYYRISPLDIVGVVALIMYAFMLAGIAGGIVIYLGIHFYQTMYTDRGYLTHTLPVGRHQLLVSKILVGGIWMFLTSLFVLLSSLAVMSAMVSEMLPDGYTLASLWKEYSGDIRQFFYLLEDELGTDLTRFWITLFPKAVASSFISVTILFGSITLGQLFHKARGLMAIVCYICVNAAMNMITSIGQGILATISSLNVDFLVDASIFVEAVAAVLLYIASYRIITRRLNME